MKRCPQCHEPLPLSAFNRNQSRCRSCQAKWYRANKAVHIAHVAANNARYIERNRQYVAEYLTNHPCVDCGETDPVVLEFDHVRGVKGADVSRLVQDAVSISRLAAEISLCDVRCANDHRRVTYARRLASARLDLAL